MAKKTVKVKLTKEEYKALKRNAKHNYISPKKYLKMLASTDFCNGAKIELPGTMKYVRLEVGKDILERTLIVLDQGKLFRDIISNGIANKRTEEYRSKNKKKTTGTKKGVTKNAKTKKATGTTNK